MGGTAGSLLPPKPKVKPYKVADAKGLFLLVQPSGALLWRVKYRFHGIERKISLGRFPDVSLKEAREKRDEARAKLEDGIDTYVERRIAKIEAKTAAESTFRFVADEFLEKMELEGRSPLTVKKNRWYRDLLDPDIGRLPVASITPQLLLESIKRVERRGQVRARSARPARDPARSRCPASSAAPPARGRSGGCNAASDTCSWPFPPSFDRNRPRRSGVRARI